MLFIGKEKNTFQFVVIILFFVSDIKPANILLHEG